MNYSQEEPQDALQYCLIIIKEGYIKYAIIILWIKTIGFSPSILLDDDPNMYNIQKPKLPLE
jgi:hypothetical protein